MKNIKWLLYSLLFLFVSQFSPAVSDDAASNDTVQLPVYVNSIDEMKLKYDGSFLGGHIKLDNGYVLRIIDYDNRDDNVISTWESGDIVYFKTVKCSDELVLGVHNIQGNNKDQVEPYVLFDLLQT